MKEKDTKNVPDPNADSNTEKYKYHQNQKEEAGKDGEAYPERPDNNTMTEDRLLNPDRGED